MDSAGKPRRAATLFLPFTAMIQPFFAPAGMKRGSGTVLAETGKILRGAAGLREARKTRSRSQFQAPRDPRVPEPRRGHIENLTPRLSSIGNFRLTGWIKKTLRNLCLYAPR